MAEVTIMQIYCKLSNTQLPPPLPIFHQARKSYNYILHTMYPTNLILSMHLINNHANFEVKLIITYFAYFA